MHEQPKNRDWVKNAAIIFLAVLLVLTFFSNTIMNRSLPEVATQDVTSGSIVARVRGTGTVTANTNSQVKMEKTRVIRSVLVKVGQQVEPGDVLFTLGEGSSEDIDAAEEKLANLQATYNRTAATMPEYSYYSDRNKLEHLESAYRDAQVKEQAALEAAKLAAPNAEQLANAQKELAAAQEIAKAEKADYEAQLDQAKNAPEIQRLEAQQKEIITRLVEDDYLDGDLVMDLTTYSDREKLVEQIKRTTDKTEWPDWSDEAIAASSTTTLSTEASDPTTTTTDPNANSNDLISDAQKQSELAQQKIAEAEAAKAEAEAAQKAAEAEAAQKAAEAEAAQKAAEDEAAQKAAEAEAAQKAAEAEAAQKAAETEAAQKAAETEVQASATSVSEEKVPTSPQTSDEIDTWYDNKKDERIKEEKESVSTATRDYTFKKFLQDCLDKYDDIQRDIYIKYNTLEPSREAYDAAVLAVEKWKTAVDVLATQTSSPQTEAYKEAKQQREWAEESYLSAKQALEEKIQANQNTIAGYNIDLANTWQQIEKAKEKLADLMGGEEAQILAKTSGVVQTIECAPGDTKQKDDVLCTLELPNMGYNLSFSVTNDQAARLRPGDTATVSNFYWGTEITATLNNIKVDPKNPQTNKLLTFDLSGNVTAGSELTLSVGQKSANYDIIIPSSAIRTDANGSFVLKVESKNSPLGNRYIARRVPVEVLASDDSNSAVSADLGFGDYVITTSSAPVKNGELVRLATS